MPSHKSDPFWKSPLIGIQKMAHLLELYRIKLDFFFFELFDEYEFKSKCQKIINLRPNAILMAPIFTDSSIEFFNSIQKLMIPIVTINTEIQPRIYNSYIGQNSFGCGYLAGRLFNSELHGHTKICCLNLSHLSIKGNQHIHDKLRGFHQYFKDNNINNIEFLHKNVTNFESKYEIQRVHENNIKEGITGLFFTNSRAYHYLAKIQGDIPKNWKIVGFDLMKENLMYLKEGQINFIIRQDPIRQGQNAINVLINHLISEQSLPQLIYMPIDIVIKENADYYLEHVAELIHSFESIEKN